VTRLVAVVAGFFRRDVSLATSTRVPFVFDLVALTFTVLEVYFVSLIVEPGAVGGGYFPFVLVALVLGAFLSAGVVTMAGAFRQEQVQGTLDVVVSTGAPIGAVAVGMFVYPAVAAAVRGVVLVGVTAVLGLLGPVARANWLLAGAALAIASLSFVALGMLASSLVLIFRQAVAVTTWIMTVLAFIAGAVFPLHLLPDWVRGLSGLSPATRGLEVMRGAILSGWAWRDAWGDLGALALMAAAFSLAGYGGLAGALRHARRNGTLAQY
jgi:ABC-2 type transport system permease protein